MEESTEVIDDHRMEADELMEEGWFFGNSLDGSKSRMFRSYSDPCSPSSFSENSYDEVYESITKLRGDSRLTRFNLVKAPSLPTSMEEKTSRNSESRGKIKSQRGSLSGGRLNRAPSLPVSLTGDEFPDEEIEFSMGKLIRQASMSNPDLLPPRIHSSKISSPSSSLSKHQSRMKPVLDSIKSSNLDRIRTPPLMNQLKPQKSSKDSPMDSNGRDESRPCISGPWRRNSSSPPLPKWNSKKSGEDMMKEQIKFWARAVASNVN